MVYPLMFPFHVSSQTILTAAEENNDHKVGDHTTTSDTKLKSLETV